MIPNPPDPTDLAVKILFEGIDRYGLKLWQKITSSFKHSLKERPRNDSFISRTGLINRERELQMIRAAILDGNKLRILYMSGEGGIGKTRILEETAPLVSSLKTKNPLVWAGIFDLARSELHSAFAFQDRLVDTLDPEKKTFTRYRKARTRYKTRAKEGVPGLEKERKDLENFFEEDYRIFANSHRIVFALDTTESVAFERDLIQDLCSIPSLPDEIFEWLLTRAGVLPNTVILLAGRPRPRLSMRLEQAYTTRPGVVEELEIHRLSSTESRHLLLTLTKDVPHLRPFFETNAEFFWSRTRGSPVQLALLVEVAAQFATQDWLSQDPVTPEIWQKRLLDAIFLSEPAENRLLLLLAVARKGLTEDLLHYLEPAWSEESFHFLSNIRHWSLAKTPPGAEGIYLHDALYELFDFHVRPVHSLRSWYESLADYYRKKQAKAGTDREAWAKASENLLYYEFQYDPAQAYENGYLYWSDLAIKGYEIGLDMRLRAELQRLMRSPQTCQSALQHGLTEAELERDSALRWLKRYVARAHHHHAVTIAETILSLGPPALSALVTEDSFHLVEAPKQGHDQAGTLFKEADDLFWGGVLTYYGEALTYLGRLDQARVILEQAVETLDYEPVYQTTWRASRVIGRAYNTLGYLWRGQGNYARAQQAFHRALKHFNFTKVETADERADTLNNLAFVYFLLGDLENAKKYIEQALLDRQNLSQRYPLALSHNTRGRIFSLQGYFERGIHECQLALSMFQELEAPRGKGLAHNALGYILRLKGAQWNLGQISEKEVIATFKESEKNLKDAVSIFSDPQTSEPLRLWEAYNELGSLYRTWGHFWHRQNNELEARKLFTQAVQHYRLALHEARQRQQFDYQQADTCDDLAQTYAGMKDYINAEKWLQQGLSLVPAALVLQEGRGFLAPYEQGQAFWLILGKAHYQKGRWSLDIQKQENHSTCYENILENFALAVAYFQQFSADTPTFLFKLKSVIEQVRQIRVENRMVLQFVKDVASRYNVDLSVLLQQLE